MRPGRRRRLAQAALGLAVLTTLSGCHVSFLAQHLRPVRGGTVTEALVGTPTVLNPLFAQDDNGRDIDSLIYQGLTTIGANQQPAPELATGWTVSPDGRVYTFTLRSGVRWADGRPFTLADVLFTFAVLQDPAYNQPLGPFWRDVVVTAAGPEQVRFTLRAPSASFPDLLSIGIIAKHLFPSSSPNEVVGDAHSLGRALGTGPFAVDSVSADRQYVKLKRNPYARPQAHLDAFAFRSFPTLNDAVQAFSTGLVDAVGGVQPPQLKVVGERPDLHLYKARTYISTAVLFNVSPATAAYLQPAAVRAALSAAVDRQRIVRSVLDGEADVEWGPVPPSDWAYAPGPPPAYNPEAAAAQLQAAGWTLSPGSSIRSRSGVPFELTLVAVDSYPYAQVAEAVAGDLRAVGVGVQVQTVPAAALVEQYLVGRRYQLLLVALDQGPDPDQYNLWHSNPASSTLSFTQLPDQAFIDRDLEQGRAASGRQQRFAIYSDFQRLMAAAAPAIFLYEPYYLYAVSARVHGVRLDPVVEPWARFAHVTDWFIPGNAL